MRELQHTYFQPQSLLGTAIVRTFGSREMFEKSLTDTCMKGQPSPACIVPVPVSCAAASASAVVAVFGSGWCWLEICGSRVSVSWKPNQVSPVQSSCNPLLGIDVWGALPLRPFPPPPSCLTLHTEHAYYLKHANKRAPYIANMVQIINVRLQFSRAILLRAVQ